MRIIAAACVAAACAVAQVPPVEVVYGPHARNKLDFHAAAGAQLPLPRESGAGRR